MGPRSMNRKFYHSGIFLWTLLLFLNVLIGTLFFFLQLQTLYLNAYPNWLIVYGLVFVSTQLVQLVYFFSKKLYGALLACSMYLLFSIGLFVVTYFMVTSQRLERLYLSSQNLLLLSTLLYGLVLFLSASRKKKWLKIAGGFLFTLGMITLVLFYYKNFSSNFEHQLKAHHALYVISLLGSLWTLPFIMNFKEDLQRCPSLKKSHSIGYKWLITCLATFVVTFSFFLLKDAFTKQLRQVTPTQSQIDLAAPFKTFAYTNAKGQKLPYRLLLPENYEATEKYPLAVCLHHGGGNGTDNVQQVEASMFARTLAEPENREKYPAVIFIPQAPPGSSFGGIPGYEDLSTLVMEAIQEIEEKYSTDPHRRYVMGMSLGGFGTWTMIGEYPHVFAAAMPVCGGGDPTKAENMLQTPIWAFHGSDDRNVPVRLSRDMVEAIREIGGQPKYTEFENVGHNVWSHVEETSGKLEWLFDQKLAK